jgi:hypothetical protein
MNRDVVHTAKGQSVLISFPARNPPPQLHDFFAAQEPFEAILVAEEILITERNETATIMPENLCQAFKDAACLGSVDGKAR